MKQSTSAILIAALAAAAWFGCEKVSLFSTSRRERPAGTPVPTATGSPTPITPTPSPTPSPRPKTLAACTTGPVTTDSSVHCRNWKMSCILDDHIDLRDYAVIQRLATNQSVTKRYSYCEGEPMAEKVVWSVNARTGAVYGWGLTNEDGEYRLTVPEGVVAFANPFPWEFQPEFN